MLRRAPDSLCYTVAMLRAFLSLWILALGACSVLFSENASSDGGDPNAPDAATRFEVYELQILPTYAELAAPPAQNVVRLFEGVGDGDGSPALLLLRGALIPLDLAASLDFDCPGLQTPGTQVGPVTVSSDQTMAVFEITVQVDENLNADCPTTLVLEGAGTETPDAATMNVLENSIVLVGLPEMTNTTLTESTDNFALLYSSILLDDLVPIRGDGGAELNSTSSIVLEGELDVSASGKMGGPGGCHANTETVANQTFCPASGLKSISEEFGGGGGGHAANGVPTEGATAGGAIGDEYFSAGLTGGGGGGAGTRADLGPGFAEGGGGGGIFSAVARGRLDLRGPNSLGTRITADGANGSTANGSSGGGGGAGGGVFLRSHTGIVTGIGGGVPTLITARQGAGAIGDTPLNGASLGDGGVGSDGRIRIDSPVATALSPSGPLPQLGPTLQAPESRVLDSQTVSLDLGSDGTLTTVTVRVNDSEYIVDLVGNMVTVDLEAGLNDVCVYPVLAQLPIGAMREKIGEYCIELAYLP